MTYISPWDCLLPLPELQIDIKKMQEHLFELEEEKWVLRDKSGLKVFRDVASFLAGKRIMDQFFDPTLFLDQPIRFLKIPANLMLNVHVDLGKKVAINLSLWGDFSEANARFYCENFRPQFSYRYHDCPVLFNGTIFHGVDNRNKPPRILLTMPFREPYTFADIKKMYFDGKLLINTEQKRGSVGFTVKANDTSLTI